MEGEYMEEEIREIKETLRIMRENKKNKGVCK